MNSGTSDGTKPSLKFGRNRSFTWQRITSWILLIGIIAHVLQMRFIEKPKRAEIQGNVEYFTKLSFDEGLYTLSPRLGVMLYSQNQIAALKTEDLNSEDPSDADFNLVEERRIQNRQNEEEENHWIETISSFDLKPDEIIAVAPNPGTALLLMVRNTFKNPLYAALYSIFVLSAAFHAMNGFWTFLITWGALLTYRSQKAMIPASVIGMGLLSFLGLAAIWGSYWINLHH